MWRVLPPVAQGSDYGETSALTFVRWRQLVYLTAASLGEASLLSTHLASFLSLYWTVGSQSNNHFESLERAICYAWWREAVNKRVLHE